MPLKPGYLLLAGGGAIFLWSGLKGKSVTGVMRAIIGGHNPATAAGANPIGSTTPSASGGTGAYVYPGTTQTGGSPGKNQALAKTLAIAMGHPDWSIGQQWSDWVKLWDQESGWNQYAQNQNSGAYGIPQSLPYTKMPRSAWPVSAGGSSNPVAQIEWGINYIAQTYGSPSNAWGHEVANNWY